MAKNGLPPCGERKVLSTGRRGSPHHRQIGEETGQITGMRVLPDGSAGSKVEVSFQASGTVMGVHGNNVGTYGSVTWPDGTLSVRARGRCEMRCPTIHPITGTRSIPLGATPG
jgi:hypothetical protein